MAKAKRMYGCTECGATFPKWAGQCAECGTWNTLTDGSVGSAGVQADAVGPNNGTFVEFPLDISTNTKGYDISSLEYVMHTAAPCPPAPARRARSPAAHRSAAP